MLLAAPVQAHGLELGQVDLEVDHDARPRVQGLVDLLVGDRLVVGVTQDVVDLLEQGLPPGLALGVVDRLDRPGVGVGVEGGEPVLDAIQARVEVVVVERRDHAGEGPEALRVLGVETALSRRRTRPGRAGGTAGSAHGDAGSAWGLGPTGCPESAPGSRDAHAYTPDDRPSDGRRRKVPGPGPSGRRWSRDGRHVTTRLGRGLRRPRPGLLHLREAAEGRRSRWVSASRSSRSPTSCRTSTCSSAIGVVLVALPRFVRV